MIIRKEVKQYGPKESNNCHVTLPVELFGQFVYIITESDMDRTYSLLDEAMIKLKVYNEENKNLRALVEGQIGITNARLTALETIVARVTTSKEIEKKASEF